MYEQILKFCQAIKERYGINWCITLTHEFIYTKFFMGDKNKHFNKIVEAFETEFDRAFVCKYQPKRTTFCMSKVPPWER